jgi:CheY-like chemotaxis protein
MWKLAQEADDFTLSGRNDGRGDVRHVGCVRHEHAGIADLVCMRSLHTDSEVYAVRYGTDLMPEFHSAVGDTIWRDGGVRCVMVPSGVGTAVELRTDQGSVFLRKQAPTITAARNEAEYLRLLLQRAGAPPPPSGLKPFALIVEDEQDTADAYREALRFSGVRALTVPNGHDALRRAGELIPDLIILDYRLPDLHGRELCRLLRANPVTMQVPILVVTASPQDNSDSNCPDAVLTKPCLLPTFLAASRLLLHRVLAASSPPEAAPPA